MYRVYAVNSSSNICGGNEKPAANILSRIQKPAPDVGLQTVNKVFTLTAVLSHSIETGGFHPGGHKQGRSEVMGAMRVPIMT